ncbi:hypothetical protein C0J52_02186 [Blattella germanica]|nr:hypothetical protein C0J52_02186 [Blattella germanica]
MSSLIASGIFPLALRMATRRLRGAAFVSSCLMMESSTSSASSALSLRIRMLAGNSADRALRQTSVISSRLQSKAAIHTCSSTKSPAIN